MQAAECPVAMLKLLKPKAENKAERAAGFRSDTEKPCTPTVFGPAVKTLSAQKKSFAQLHAFNRFRQVSNHIGTIGFGTDPRISHACARHGFQWCRQKPIEVLDGPGDVTLGHCFRIFVSRLRARLPAQETAMARARPVDLERVAAEAPLIYFLASLCIAANRIGKCQGACRQEKHDGRCDNRGSQ